MVFKRPRLILRSALLLLVVLLPGSLAQVHGQPWKKVVNGEQKIIIIDPGHGGRDHGASGFDQASEKVMTLALANIFKEKFADKYEVVLTRTGDYALGISERAAFANGAGGDLLISLHSGGGFTRRTTGVELYYYREESGRVSSLEGSSRYENEGNTGMIDWDEVHLTHDKASRDFVNIVYQELVKNIDNVQPPTAVPLLLFAGLNMPAMCIEVRYPTPSAHDGEYPNKAYMERLAGGIARGIDLFFKKTN